MSDSLSAEITLLTQQLQAARAAWVDDSPPSPEDLAGLLSRCRALAWDDQALDLGRQVVELILDLARDQGPQYLAALEGGQA